MPVIEIVVPDDIIEESGREINADVNLFCSKYGLRWAYREADDG